MRFQCFASGSSGNCIYIGSESTHILIDTGISRKKTMECLKSLELTLSDLSAVFITHEHSDHIAGLAMIEKSEEIPIYASKGTIRALSKMPQLSHIGETVFREIKADEKVRVGDLLVSPIRIHHDAAEPFAYRVWYGQQKACVCTDLGNYDAYTVECLKHSDVLLLESNHDVRMLQLGHYPYPLKQRILGDYGHLSNDSCAKLLGEVLHSHMQAVFLGHLSRDNNMPEIAYETVRLSMLSGDGIYRAKDFPLYVAKRDAPSELIEF